MDCPEQEKVFLCLSFSPQKSLPPQFQDHLHSEAGFFNPMAKVCSEAKVCLNRKAKVFTHPFSHVITTYSSAMAEAKVCLRCQVKVTNQTHSQAILEKDVAKEPEASAEVSSLSGRAPQAPFLRVRSRLSWWKGAGAPE